MPNIWVWHKSSKKTNQQFMFQMWVLQIILTNYCVFYDLYANISH